MSRFDCVALTVFLNVDSLRVARTLDNLAHITVILCRSTLKRYMSLVNCCILFTLSDRSDSGGILLQT